MFDTSIPIRGKLGFFKIEQNGKMSHSECLLVTTSKDVDNNVNYAQGLIYKKM